MSDLYIEARLHAIKDIASASCSDEKDADNISDFCDEIYSAIEIVKQGGVSDASDNVCEWKKYPFDWFTGCDGYKIHNKQGNYCPRCGNKIKIVGD